VVARLDAFHSCTDLLDYTRPLMAEDQGQRHRIVLVANVDVGLAEAGRDNSYEHLVLAGFIQIKLPEDEWSGLSFDNRGSNSHRVSPAQHRVY
jgi:hypothetical protein